MKKIIALLLVISILIGLYGCSELKYRKLQLPVSVTFSDTGATIMEFNWLVDSKEKNKEVIILSGEFHILNKDICSFSFTKHVNSERCTLLIYGVEDGVSYITENIKIHNDTITTSGILECDSWGTSKQVDIVQDLGVVFDCYDEYGNPYKISSTIYNRHHEITYEEVTGWSRQERNILAKLSQEAFVQCYYILGAISMEMMG